MSSTSPVLKNSRARRMNRCANSNSARLAFLRNGRCAKLSLPLTGLPVALAQTVTESVAVDHGVCTTFFERASVVPRHKILEAALVKGCGQLELEQFKK